MDRGINICVWGWSFTPDELKWAHDLALRRIKLFDDAKKSLVASDRPMEWPYYLGNLGEYTFSKIFDIRMDTSSSPTEGDGGVDFILHGKEIDVKCRGRGWNFYMPLRSYQRGLRAEIYVIATMVTPKYCVLKGWLTQNDIHRLHEVVDVGYGPSIKIEYSHFHPMHKLEDACRTIPAEEMCP